MSEELVFYTHPMSRGRTVRWILEELGVPYRTELLDYGTSMKAPDYLAINPLGKVPAITHKGAVVTETAAICTYLADAYPDAGLAPLPSDAARRAPYLRWMFFAAGPIEAAATNRALKLEAPAERAALLGYGSFDDAVDTLAAVLQKSPYIAGDLFTAADVITSVQIAWGVLGAAKERAPEFQDYLDRTTNRPAAVRAREIDDALLAAKTE